MTKASILRGASLRSQLADPPGEATYQVQSYETDLAENLHGCESSHQIGCSETPPCQATR